MSSTNTHAPIEPSVALYDDAIVALHQLVLRQIDDSTHEEWIVTGITTDSDTRTIELANPNFEFRLSVDETVFREKGFDPLVATDGVPVWGY